MPQRLPPADRYGEGSEHAGWPRRTSLEDMANPQNNEPQGDDPTPSSMTTLLGAGAGVAVLFLVLRVLAVAHWDWNVAGHIFDAFDFGGAVGVAVGTLFADANLAAFVISIITPVSLLAMVHAVRQRTSMLAALATSVLSVSMLLSLGFTAGAWWGILVAVTLSVALFLLGQLRRAGRLHAGIEWITRRLGITVLVGLFVLVIGVQEPWASAELITMTDGTTRELYVLSESPSGMHVLVPGGDVEVLMNSDVISRTYP